MPSRPSHQERIQQDLDEILGQLATLAKALLIRNGEFFPFGATIGKRGKFALLTPVPEGDRPTAQDVIDAVMTDIRASSGSLRAYGVAAMAVTASDADAVRIELEHAEGSSLVITLPYVRGDFGTFTYGDMEARRTDRRIWPLDAPTRTRSSKRAAAPKAKAASKATPKRSGSAKPAKEASKPRSTGKSSPTAKRGGSAKPAKAKPPRESRPPTGTGHPAVRAPRKTLQTQSV